MFIAGTDFWEARNQDSSPEMAQGPQPWLCYQVTWV